MRSVVIGGGWAGLLTAVALARVHESVVLLERARSTPDRSTEADRAVQRKQLHNLLGAGSEALEKLIPGFRQRLGMAGASRGDVAAQTHVFEAGLWFPTRPLGLEIWSAPRALFEDVVRAELRLLTNVTVAQGVRAVALETRHGRVTGVTCSKAGEDARILPADLVVDASAGAFKGAPPVPVSRATSLRWYASAEVTPSESILDEFWMVFPWAGTRGALISPSGAGSAKISVSGRLTKDPIPKDWPDLAEYVTGLEDPLQLMPDLLKQCRPERSDLAIFRQPISTWRHFEQISLPVGFAPIGDSIARLTPLTGQGLSVSAQQVLALRDLVGVSSANSYARLREAQDAYIHSASEWVGRGWHLQILNGDRELESRHGRRFSLVHDDIQKLALKAVRDENIHRAYVGLWHLTTSPDCLLPILGDHRVRLGNS